MVCDLAVELRAWDGVAWKWCQYVVSVHSLAFEKVSYIFVRKSTIWTIYHWEFILVARAPFSCGRGHARDMPSL